MEDRADVSAGERERSGLDWAARVQRLEAEVDGLRRAMRSRAVIEQAKGFLSAALNCGLDEAFGHLARLSQYENLKVVEVAARIIGAAVPTEVDEPEAATAPQVDVRLFDPLTYVHGAATTAGTAEGPAERVPFHDPAAPPGPSHDPAAPPGPSHDPAAPPSDVAVLPAEVRIRLQTAAAAIQSAETPTDLADRLLEEGTGWLEPEAVMIWTSETDGALQLAACAGVPPQVASDWQRIPSRFRVPVRDAIATDEPVWLDALTPHDYDVMRPGSAAASLPLRHSGRPFAGLVVLWDRGHEFPDTERRYLTALSALVARRYRALQLSGSSGMAPGHWLQGLLDALPVATFLLAPVRDEEGTVVDFMIDYASPQAGEPYAQIPGDLVGRRLLDVRPQLANTGVFEAYRQVLVGGGVWRQPAQPEIILIEGAPEQRVISRSAIRLGDGLLASWRVHDADAQLTRVTRMEDLGGLGYVEWDLVSGNIYWSPGTFRLFDRSPQRGPLSLDQLPDHVVPEDLAMVQQDLRTLLEGRQPVDLSIRLRVGGGERPIRAVISPSLDDNGDVIAVYALVQDLTEVQRRTEAQRRTEHAAKARRIHDAIAPRRDW